MSSHAFTFCNEDFLALPSGALFWPAQRLLCVSDLHFGKASRYALHGASVLPPYEVHDTLLRLDQDIAEQRPKAVICLGDSFDRVGASDDLDPRAREWIIRLQAGVNWIWIEGNHDPGPLDLGGTHMHEVAIGPIVFRHIALGETATGGEVSGHYHPKATVRAGNRAIIRRCFATDAHRIILPAYGTYTGGLNVNASPISTLLATNAICILTGAKALPIPRSKTRS